MKQADSSLSFPLLIKALERCVFPAGLHYPYFLPFGKGRIYGDIKSSFLGKVRIKHIDLCDILDILVGKINK